MLPRVADLPLLTVLMSCAKLTKDQAQLVATAFADVTCGGVLTAARRQHFMQVAIANRLLPRPAERPKRDATVHAGDPYSTRTTTGTAVAESVIAKYTARDASGALTIKPPQRKRTSAPPPPTQDTERKTG